MVPPYCCLLRRWIFYCLRPELGVALQWRGPRSLGTVMLAVGQHAYVLCVHAGPAVAQCVQLGHGLAG